MFFTLTRELGKIVKTHGVRGDVVVATNFNISDEFELNESVFIVIDGLPVPFFLEHYIIFPPNTIRLKFDTINDVEKASMFYNCIVRVEKDLLKNIVEEFSLNSIKGYKLYNSKKEFIGNIIGHMDISMNPLVIVNHLNKEVLVPFNDDTIIQIDKKQKKAFVDIADGLFDIE